MRETFAALTRFLRELGLSDPPPVEWSRQFPVGKEAAQELFGKLSSLLNSLLDTSRHDIALFAVAVVGILLVYFVVFRLPRG